MFTNQKISPDWSNWRRYIKILDIPQFLRPRLPEKISNNFGHCLSINGHWSAVNPVWEKRRYSMLWILHWVFVREHCPIIQGRVNIRRHSLKRSEERRVGNECRAECGMTT